MTTAPHLWLEEIDSSRSLEWVNACNSRNSKAYGSDEEFLSCRDPLLDAYQSKEKIPYPTVRGDICYDIWTDSDHVRGIWRRTAFEAFKAGKPQ